ncbi:MAG: RiPP maturation radical SAM C-methyltransferase [Chloroflexi bacterium]|nr:RiPP maturation radical SAM C-methyltransferase [Chloroflexota bacterium]
MPSIQLATLAAALKREGIKSESHELFLDYGARIGLNLYKIFSSLLGFTAQWLFAQHYFGPEAGNYLTDFRAHRPRLGLSSVEIEDSVLDTLAPVTEEFLTEISEDSVWSRYDVIGFSLTISQLAPSMALARLLKKLHPNVTIVFGGAECAGPMGSAILKMCPYVDVVVRVEGEGVLPELVRRIRDLQGYEDLHGVSWRQPDGIIINNPTGPLLGENDKRLPLRYDEFFERLQRLNLKEKLSVWLPYESSRGCWYGEKIQCTFCGLHDIMEYRTRDADHVLAEMEDLARRYGINRLFSVDLIMPRAFFKTLLPKIIERGHKWFIFYEIKANMKRHEIELLAKSGVRWIQPGIESLDQDLLRMMKKGVSPLQNIQLLKWCKEFGIRVSWNLLSGMPGDKDESYLSMAEVVPKLSHLAAPSGVGPFQLHRFSPYFDQPEQFGIDQVRAHHLFQYVFPIPKEELDELVYLFEYKTIAKSASPKVIRLLEEKVRNWREDNERGAELTIRRLTNGSAQIKDTRGDPSASAIHELKPSEVDLYMFLDAAVSERTLGSKFALAHPDSAEDLGGQDSIEATIDRWKQSGLVFSDNGSVLGLAVNASDVLVQEEYSANISAPVA